jgi:hypothetical protein
MRAYRAVEEMLHKFLTIALDTEKWTFLAPAERTP